MNIRTLFLIGACSFAVAGSAIAQPPADADDTEEWAQQWGPEDPLHDAGENAIESDLGDDIDGDAVLYDTSMMDDPTPSASDAPPAEPEPSLKREVKRTLFGALLPAIERRVRDAIDKDN